MPLEMKAYREEVQDGRSSRIVADEILDNVLKMLRGEEVDFRDPWRFHAVHAIHPDHDAELGG